MEQKKDKTIIKLKKEFVDFVRVSEKQKLLSEDHEMFTYDFILRNPALLNEIDINDASCDLSNYLGIPYGQKLNSKVKTYLDKSLPYLFEEVTEIVQQDENLSSQQKIRIVEPVSQETQKSTVQSMFSGLRYYGSNDADYTKAPSALAMSAFNL